MAPIPLKRLTALQYSRINEIERMSTRFREKPPDSLNKNIIDSRIDNLNGIWSEARGTHALIIVRDDTEADPYITDNIFPRLQTLYEDLLDELLTRLARFEGNSVLPALTVSANNEVSNARLDTAKLPKLDLPKFSGRYEDWENATKLSYLKLCLTGTAADLIKEVTTTDANYLTTWQALKQRFYNPRLIVSNYLNAIMNMGVLKKESAANLLLSNLKMPVLHWNIWLTHVLSAKLDTESKKLWETELSVKDRTIIGNGEDSSASNLTESGPLDHFPKFSEFVEFLEKRSQTLNMITVENVIEKKSHNLKQGSCAKKVFHAQHDFKISPKCALCSGIHSLWRCYKLKAKSPFERRSEIRRLKLCFNCFGKHKFDACNSKGRCNTCHEKHHTLLHFDSKRAQNIPGASEKGTASDNVQPQNVKTLTANIFNRKRWVILATAQVLIKGPYGKHSRVRALLDQGSEATFITESIAQLLGLPTRATKVCLSGLGENAAGTAKKITSLTVQSIVAPEFKLEMQALVLPRLTSHLPARNLIEIELGEFANINLADPQFYIKDSIDMILGADVYGKLLLSGVRNYCNSGLVAQQTVLGWVLSGYFQSGASRRAAFPTHHSVNSVHCVSDDLNNSLQRFWDLEDLPDASAKLKPEDEACEHLFRETYARDSDGRFIVRLPLKSNPPAMAVETQSIALGSLSHLHKRFERDSNLAQAYREFMSEYEKLGHMARIPINEIDNSYAWYLPHHAVVRFIISRLKLRVVFDASRLTRDKHCLNNFLMSGPALQSDISLILLNWRSCRYVFTADIVKMYRQIRVSREHQDYQRILWAPRQSEPPVEYRLTTVTYGTSCAPYLAIRTLLQLAENQRSRFPLGAKCLENNIYVDDIFSGADELSAASTIRNETVEILKTAGIELDKWAANHGDLLPTHKQSYNDIEKSIDKDTLVKTLGILWDPKSDVFKFSTVDFKTLSAASSKRAILSNIARLFDPLGWLSPITVISKILMQDLWILKCDWDTPLPIIIRDQWLEYCNSLASLSNLTVDRWLGSFSESSCQLHGFSDASSRAYAAAVYLRVHEGGGNFRVSLLAAKTKVAPVKTLSIPNLELCGAVLLVKLIAHLQKSDFLKKLSVYAWSDSQVVLTWLRKHPGFWKTFVANRVSYIQTELPSATWAHISTKENPADVATRGSKPSDLKENDLWWHGLTWLSVLSASWPKTSEKVQILHSRNFTAEPEIITRFSSLTRLLRVVAYCLRPLLILRRRKNSIHPLPPFLTTGELSMARNAVIKLVQTSAFTDEINKLQEGKQLPKRSILLKLNPILDKDGILRVGGRLAHSGLSYESKNPPILPHSSILSALIVRQAHRACLHGGPTLTNSLVSRNAWILDRKRLVKSEIYNCVTCQRVKPRLAHQLMGDLPSIRVTPARPFSNTGLDYAGPIQVRTTKGRGHKSFKGYIALFICLTTRAIHLEIVSDCTSGMFIAAYKRFVSRRGICRTLISDNATNFHGADKELKNMFNAASDFYKGIASILANDGTDWKFIPPNAPHYGGIWEAGVKATKHHLKRVIGDHTLTFEELSTLVAEIEACLNSRPLRPMSSAIDDMHALTPAHFLIGEVSGLVPDEEPPKIPENRLSRFQLIQRIRNNFWKRWSSEYLQHLQERGKWKNKTGNFAVGQLVLVMDERYPPSKWPLGRVMEVHNGADGLVRVVTVKTSTAILKRHIARLCPLSMCDDLEKSK